MLLHSSRINALLKNFEKAIEEAETVIFLKPENYTAYPRIFSCYIHMNQIDKAKEQLDRIKKKFPGRNLRFQEGLYLQLKVTLIDTNYLLGRI